MIFIVCVSEGNSDVWHPVVLGGVRLLGVSIRRSYFHRNACAEFQNTEERLKYKLKDRFYYISIYRVSQEECARLREGVPYVKVYRYNPKHLCPNLNG